MIAIGCATAASVPLEAQSGSDRAFVAMRATHVGALTPLLTPSMVIRRLDGAQLALRYGLRDENSVRSQAIAATALFSAGLQSSVSLTAGVNDADCVDCSPALMLGLGGDMRLYESGDAVGAGSSLSLAVAGDVGYARVEQSDESAFVLGISAPLTLNFAGDPQGMRLAPYFTPLFGIGSTSGDCGLLNPDCQKSGVRWSLGGGLAVWSPTSSIAASIGMNQVLRDGARPVFGINVHVGGR